MPVVRECEIKFAVDDLAPLRPRLAALGAVYAGRCFEVNRVYDDPARSLRARGVLLRLRQDRRALLTLKRPAAGHSGSAKVLEEIETEVADFDAAHELLAALGYAVAFGYEKLRETWELGAVHICLDLLPFGAYVELEGPEEALPAAAASLGLPPGEALAASYHQLNAAWRAAAGLPPQDGFRFSPEQAVRLRAASFSQSGE